MRILCIILHKIGLVVPVYKVSPNPVEAEAGKSVSVHFSLENEQQCGEISHSLRKEGSENITTPYEIVDNEIVFPQIEVEDRGLYIISCRNAVGEGTASFVLDIKGNASIVAGKALRRVSLVEELSISHSRVSSTVC